MVSRFLGLYGVTGLGCGVWGEDTLDPFHACVTTRPVKCAFMRMDKLMFLKQSSLQGHWIDPQLREEGEAHDSCHDVRVMTSQI